MAGLTGPLEGSWRGLAVNDNSLLRHQLSQLSRSSTAVEDLHELKKACLEEAYGDQIRQRKAVLVPVGDSFRLVQLTQLSPDDKDLLLQKVFPSDGEDLGIVAKIRGRMERYVPWLQL